MPVLWAYARDLFQTPGFGDTTDFTQIKQHYYVVHTDLNPTQIVPGGPGSVELARLRTSASSWRAGRSATAPRRHRAGGASRRCRPRTESGRLSSDRVLVRRTDHRSRRAGPVAGAALLVVWVRDSARAWPPRRR